MGVTDLDIYNELRAIRAVIEALPQAIVAEIAAKLIEPAETVEPAPAVCQHPEDKRVDLGDGDWDCGIRGCNHQHREQPQGAAV